MTLVVEEEESRISEIEYQKLRDIHFNHGLRDGISDSRKSAANVQASFDLGFKDNYRDSFHKAYLQALLELLIYTEKDETVLSQMESLMKRLKMPVSLNEKAYSAFQQRLFQEEREEKNHHGLTSSAVHSSNLLLLQIEKLLIDLEKINDDDNCDLANTTKDILQLLHNTTSHNVSGSLEKHPE